MNNLTNFIKDGKSNNILLNEYEEEMWRKDFTSSTINVYINEVVFFYDWLLTRTERDFFDLLDVDEDLVSDYKSHLYNIKLKTTTVNKKRQSLFNFYIWLKRKGFIVKNPFKTFDFSHIKSRRFTLQFLSDREVKEINKIFVLGNRWLKKEIFMRDKAIYILIRDLALRVREITDLKTKDFDKESRMLRIVGKEERWLKVTDDVYESLNEWLELKGSNFSPYMFRSQKSDKITPNTIHILIEKIRGEVNVVNLTTSSLRNTRIMKWRREGLSTEEVRRRAGHINKITTRYYFDKYQDID